jgi:malate:quinone-oxidoreductase
MTGNRSAVEPDIVLAGAGIMSATLGVLQKELEPSLTIEMFETLGGAAQESSDAWNNAGTGHAANCELNYTPERSDGTIDISKALDVNVEFDLSRQFWSYLVKGAIVDPRSFIHPVPHMSFVHGPENVAFLKKRFAAMSAHHCYHGMEYTEDKRKLAEWVALVMEGRAIVPDDWTKIIFNRVVWVRFPHMLLAAFLTGAFCVAATGAWYLLRERYNAEAHIMLRMGLGLAAVLVPSQ